MGANVSSSDVDVYIKDTIKVLNDASDQCWQSVSSSNVISVDGATYVDINNNTQNIETTADLTCVSENTFATDTQTTLDQNIQNHAEAVKSGLSLGLNVSNQYTDLTTKLSTTIQNTFSSEMHSMSNANNTISVTNSDHIYIADNDQEITQDTVAKNVTKNSAVQHIAQDMKDIIDASSNAESSGGGWLMIIAAIVAVVIFFVVAIYFGGIKILLSPSFWFLCATCVLIGCGFGVLGYFMSWWPYDKVDPNDDSSEQQDTKDHNNTWLYTFLGVGGAMIVADVFCVVLMKILSGKRNKTITTTVKYVEAPTTLATPATPATPSTLTTPSIPTTPIEIASPATEAFGETVV